MSHYRPYDLTVYIGRFQPLHDGHIKTLQEALKKSEKVLVLVGSSYSCRSIKNPFTFEERRRMIHDTFPYETMQAKNLVVEPIIDTLYNDGAWVSQVRFKATEQCPNGKVALIGFEKDASSYYLKMFPDWEHIYVEPTKTKDGSILNGTDIRSCIFTRSEETLSKLISYNPWNYILQEDEAKILRDEYKHIQEYKDMWKDAPFPPTFNCSDAIVVQSGHVLLVKRGEQPGKDLFALPGGFINPDEKALDAAIRELREETRVKVPEKVLKGSVFEQQVFDDPARSTRGRTFSHAYGFKLDDSLPLPEVRGGDDAKHAMWVPFEVLRTNQFREKMFEDHASILDWFLTRI